MIVLGCFIHQAPRKKSDKQQDLDLGDQGQGEQNQEQPVKKRGRNAKPKESNQIGENQVQDAPVSGNAAKSSKRSNSVLSKLGGKRVKTERSEDKADSAVRRTAAEIHDVDDAASQTKGQQKLVMVKREQPPEEDTGKTLHTAGTSTTPENVADRVAEHSAELEPADSAVVDARVTVPETAEAKDAKGATANEPDAGDTDTADQEQQLPSPEPEATEADYQDDQRQDSQFGESRVADG